ncbi:MAG: PQQ-binding-like beta-propeller repeat protein [Candidatus Aminicenantes bacterium]|nr:PQQ-binding-like beta-propeller repeat protein [Candidatus Aminicenantes bacterium]
MKVRFILAASLLIFMVGCGKSALNMIPEISPPLIQEEVFSWTGQTAGHVLFSCTAGVGWVDKSGQIVTWNPEQKTAGKIFPLPFAVSDPPLCQGDFLALQSQTGDQLLVFDLVLMKIKFAASQLTVKRILGVDGRHLVHLDGENLVVRDLLNPDAIFYQPTIDQDFFNCCFFPERILIMSRGHFFVFWRHNGKFQQVPLPLPAVSPFACQGGNIFYGSRQRQLVKYSLRRRKLIWKLKLGHDLVRQPLVQAGTIVVSPADNNVLLVSGSGNIRWWLALNSIMQSDLVPLVDHLAAFLINHEIKFIHIRSQQVTPFKIQGRPAGMPLAYKNDLYFLVAAGEKQKLQRVGNQYGLEVTVAPGQAQWLGVPVTVSFRSSNLLKPLIQCVIRDQSGKTVLLKKFGLAAQGQLVWLPQRAGIYQVHVSAVALNRKDEKEVSFQVFDPRPIMSIWPFHF